jgi:hypothetical protein
MKYTNLLKIIEGFNDDNHQLNNLKISREIFLKTTALSLLGIPLLNEEANSQQKKKVILCFDGSRDNSKWMSSISLSKKLSDVVGHRVSFTYYVNSAYFFTKIKGRSEIGYGGTKEEIDLRLKLVQEAINEGHEIGSHTVRHQHGHSWSYLQWLDELSEFDEHIAHFFKDKQGKPYKSIGFRAPYLEWNENLYKSLKELNYIYDVSMVGNHTLKKQNIITKGVPLYHRPNGKIILGMDYNWHISKLSDCELEKMLSYELQSFNNEPIIISLHFSDWKHGNISYFEVVENFLTKGAKNNSLDFCSMKEYINSLS